MARQALGKGLGALIPTNLQNLTPEEKASVGEVSVHEIQVNPFQPRTHFDSAKLKELTDSIKEAGMLQPIVVAKRAGGGYTLISGERRLRAVQGLGHQRVPAVVKEAASNEQLAEWALIENLQRDDLNAMEEARAYRRLVDELKITQEQVAQKVGKDRSTVANSLRLLRLPMEVQDLVEDGRLSMGHVRALLGVEKVEILKSLALAAEREGWSVRQTEARAREAAPSQARKKVSNPNSASSIEIRALEDKLKRSLGTKVKIAHKGKAGVIEVHYYSEEELERLLDLLAKS